MVQAEKVLVASGYYTADQAKALFDGVADSVSSNTLDGASAAVDPNSQVKTQIQKSVDNGFGVAQQAALGGAQAVVTNVNTTMSGYATQIAALKSGIQAADDGANTLSAGILKIEGYTTALQERMMRQPERAAFAYLAAGAQGVSDGLAQLTGTSSKLTAGASQIESGLSSASSGAGTLKSGVEAHTSGVSSVNDGASQVAAGASSAADGAAALADGTSQLTANNDSLNSGASSLNSGLGTLSSGASTLYAGTTELNNNSSALTSGASSLGNRTEYALYWY